MNNPSPATPAVNDFPVRYTQDDRDRIVEDVMHRGYGGIFRKHSRILAVQENEPFIVETDRGPMTGKPGDWIVTNHPEDDSGSDVWSISNDRMQATYHPWDRPVINELVVTPASVLIRHAIDAVRDEGDSRPNSVVITKLEEALLWLNHETVVGG